MYKKIIFLPFVFFTSLLFAQNEGNIWYFGENAGIDFNSGSPVVLTDGAMNTWEGCATISDNTGDLLFYTDGISIWNSNHNIMPNGNGLMGDPSSTQSAIIVKKPGISSIYYVFTVDEEAGPNGLRYSEVDMSYQGGLGDINTNKNIPIVTPTCEKVAAIKHQNGTDFWIVTHLFGSNDFHSYLLTSSGLNMNPVISSIGSGITVAGSNGIGYLRSSRDGSRLVSSNDFMSEFELFDFNNSNGLLSNVLTFSGLVNPYGVEFSPNGNLLYVCSEATGEVSQYDLLAGSFVAIVNSKVILGGANFGGALQLGPDNKIYQAKWTQGYLGVINNPNLIGNSCNYIANGLFLSGKTSTGGLPTFVSSINNENSQVVIEDCETILKMPNVFSPNNDGLNNLFLPSKIECIEQADIVIYNRWGQEMFNSSDIMQGWNGRTTSGSTVPEGTYYWIVNYIDIQQNQSTLTGFVTLLK